MATVLPPPSKRQRREALEHASKPVEPAAVPTGSIRIQFQSRADGSLTGPAVSVALAQASVRNLEILLNSLLGVVEAADRIPYRFFHERRRAAGADVEAVEEESLADNADLFSALVLKGVVSAEEEIVLRYSPQAVFRVRAVSRCASAITGHGEPILAAQFSPQSASRLVTGSGDSTARIWDCDTGTPLHTLAGHKSWVLCVAYSPDGSLIATGSNDKTLRIWEASTGRPLGGILKGHAGFIRSLCWEPYHLQSPGRPRLASSSKDATVRIWDVVSGHTDIVLSGHRSSVSCVKWGGTGLIYTSSSDRTIKVWDPAHDGILLHTLTAHAHWVNHLALSTDFVLRTAFHAHGALPPAAEEDRIATARQRFESAARVSNQIRERLVSASDDNLLYLWDPLGATPTKPVAPLNGHQKQINHVVFSPDGAYIASASFDNSVKLWSARNGAFLLTLRAHVAPVYMCAFSADSRMLVSGSKDTTLKCWEVRTGKMVGDLPGHADEVYAVDWSADGKAVASGGRDRAVRLWRH